MAPAVVHVAGLAFPPVPGSLALPRGSKDDRPDRIPGAEPRPNRPQARAGRPSRGDPRPWDAGPRGRL